LGEVNPYADRIISGNQASGNHVVIYVTPAILPLTVVSLSVQRAYRSKSDLFYFFHFLREIFIC
jgi:hypothetical protein